MVASSNQNGSAQSSKEEQDKKRIELFHTLEMLKKRKRAGWVRQGLKNTESISDHMYRMAMLALLSEEDNDLDVAKCVQLAIVHDMAEAETGDITPHDGISKADKNKMEHGAMERITKYNLAPGSTASNRISNLWKEYEARETKEAKFVKDLDWFELAVQATEYERDQDITTLQPFFETTVPLICHPEVRRWADTLMEERRSIWIDKGRADSYVHVSTTTPQA